MTLPEYVQAECGKPFRLGAEDCAHFVARWVQERTGRDGLAIFGGLDRDAADDLVSRKRLLRSFFEGCRSIGLPRAEDPRSGDVGVIRCGNRHRCAIRSESGWLYRDETGVVFVTAALTKPLMAWRVA
ncbi:MAG: hypothetical protein V7704_20605 [Aurantimonas endophytica]|uniref:DUF6950 family protein n=1 Tax=Aurantimonas endophytica TaxID=1522175 RepID=UPI003001D28F